MDEQLKKAGKNIVDFWNKLSKKIKILIFSILGVVLIGAVILSIMLNKTEYVVLFSQLSDEEVTEVMAKLQEKDVTYKYEKNGQILVEESDEALLRMQLAEEGYPRSGLNYNIFTSNIDFMTTDYEKKQYKIFQLQERIQASIETITGVKKAIVTINIPDENNFAWDTDKEESSASVKINMISGYTLTKTQVDGIQQLVEKSISGLKTENIAIIDTQGNNLITEDEMLQTDTLKLKLEIEKQIQNDIESSIKKLLEKAYGKDNVEVSAKCTMNLDKKITENLEYIPDKDSNSGVIQSEDRNIEAVGDGEVTGGVTGTETNSEIPVYPDVEIDGENIYYKDSSSINYLVSQIKQQIQHEPGTVENLSVAVIINKANIIDNEKEEIRNLVAHSAGIDVSKVALYNMEFKSNDIPTFDTDGNLNELSDRQKLIIAACIAGFFILLIIIIIIILKVKKAKRLKKEAELLEAENANKVPEDSWENIKDEIEVKETKEIVLKKQITDFSSANPDIAAQLLRTWLKGEED